MSRLDIKWNKKRIVGMVICILIFGMIALSYVYIPYEIDAMDSQARYEAPSFTHLFGTDNLGRDVFSRTIVALRTSFFVALLSIGTSLMVACFLGGAMGYFGGIPDRVLVRIIDVIAAIPSILLALVIISITGVGAGSIFFALFIAFIPSFTRVVRAEFIKEKEQDYVKNAKLLGAGSLRIMFVHILPNTLGVIFSSAVIGFNNAILAESSLSYLSLGVAPPNASLGVMLSDAQSSLINAPWCAVFPGLFLMLMVLGISLLNESNVGINFLESRMCVKRKNVEKETNDIGNIESGEEYKKDKIEKYSNVLEVENLDIEFADREGIVKAVSGISFYVRRGEILGIVGESGSGKSVTALSIMGLLNNRARAICDKMVFDNRDLTTLTSGQLLGMRGRDIAIVFQEPMTAFNPAKTIGNQLEEILVLHEESAKTGKEMKARIIEALFEVKINNPDEVYNMYPHMLSGGMCQRALIAMAMLMRPKLLIVDEPTTALDKKVALEIIDLLKGLNKKYNTSILFISHDLFMIKQTCEDVLVMEKGCIVERAAIDDLFKRPKKEYTQKLINSYLGNTDYRQDKEKYKNNEVIIEAKDLIIGYKTNKFLGREKRENRIVSGPINLKIRTGQIFGICGPSGCGKSTFAKTICGIIQPLEGQVLVNEKVAMVFQNPYMSLTPWMNVERILMEPLINNGIKDRKLRYQKVCEIIKNVGLEKRHLKRKIKHLSGGQRQRIAIAQALISGRKIIILDEPVSALDATVQRQVIELLARLKEEYNLTYIMISHDEMVIDTMCDEKFTKN
ncbi:MAG: ATP-binding cassette domain-containing protein [Lachnospiraceae bacterium]|nr:ATP-binding cassette domain-containing protein [Lachnospiraceae bacterium]